MSKQKITIVKEEKPVNYTARLQCKNCNRMRHAEIQKAKTVEAFSKETPCPNCGCVGMEKVK